MTKKLLILGITTLITLGSYTSAGTLTCPGNLADCSPTINHCFDGETQIGFKNNEGFEGGMYIRYGDDETMVAGSSEYVYITPPDGICELKVGTAPALTVEYDIPTPQADNSLIKGGITVFSGIIERLGSIFGEFGPYMIYIAIACLGVSLMFKALKYILGFTDNSAKNSIGGRQGMKERRRRRRKNRRLQRYIYRNERGRYGETYNQKYRKQYNNDMKFGSRGYNSRK